VIGFEESTTPQLWYRCKTAFTKSGVSVPLIFRVATTSDCKNPMKKHKRRNLWKMPLRDALEVAKAHAEGGGAAAADDEMHAADGEAQGRKRGASGAKRGRVDEDGDVIMVRHLNPESSLLMSCLLSELLAGKRPCNAVRFCFPLSF
jgi:hypothetical protein